MIGTSVPQSARIWNYWLGGKDNYPVDQEVGDQFCTIFPDIIAVARASRHEHPGSLDQNSRHCTDRVPTGGPAGYQTEHRALRRRRRPGAPG
jgi:hypothetical protein